MHGTSRLVRRVAASGVALLLFAIVAPGVAHAAPPRVGLRLFAAQDHVVLKRSGKRVWLDVGAYIAADRSAFDIRAWRNNYKQPIQVEQVLHASDGTTTTRQLPADVADGWLGLSRFIHVTVRDDTGATVVRWTGDFCPDGFGQRVNDQGPVNQTFPNYCYTNPLTLGMVWGIDRGWAVDPMSYSAPVPRLPDGHYRVTISIADRYRSMFAIPNGDASVTVSARVRTVKHRDELRHQPRPGAPAQGPTAAPTVTHPDKSALPDLVPLPSWGISTFHRKGHDYLDFGATVWVGGTAPLVVEGFRRPGTDVMDAYQYFYKDGAPIGRVRVGTFTYDRDPGHQHWHFKQFARYSLLDQSHGHIVRSEKTGFCIAPTDAIDLTLRHAEWNPQTGFSICGDQNSVWVREQMPVGWGDTYFQFLPGQSFDVSNLPNGTYYIEVQANPLGSLYESSATNDVSYRRVILGGRPGRRTVKVPPWHGIDTEQSCPPSCGGVG
jgi:hypothetical protein